jgi:hypothetical protein
MDLSEKVKQELIGATRGRGRHWKVGIANFVKFLSEIE